MISPKLRLSLGRGTHSASYHMSKTTAEYRRRVRLIRMDWSAQSPNLKPIENLCRIKEVPVSAKRHRIRSLESMKEVIKEE